MIELRQSEIERKAFLMLVIAGVLSGLVALGARAAITGQLSPAPAAVAAQTAAAN